MPTQLNNINFELQRELELANNRLAIAMEGLRAIKENADTLNIAEKTLQEIDNYISPQIDQHIEK